MISNPVDRRAILLILGILGVILFGIWPEWRVHLQGSGYYYGEPVQISLKPGSDLNKINLKSGGIIKVALMTTSFAEGDPVDFDALQVDPLSVVFGPNEATERHGRGHVEDVDNDGDPDLVLHFRVRETGIQCADSLVILSGKTYEGEDITGADSVTPTGC